MPELAELFAAQGLFTAQGNVATTAQLLDAMGRARFESAVSSRQLAVVWTGIYSPQEPDDAVKLSGLDLRAGEPVALCLASAAAAYGFDTEDVIDLHVLTPDGHQLRSSDGLIVHRRDGAPIVTLDGRPITAPAWTAVEVARALRRPRALATLDAALRSRTCDQADLAAAAKLQKGRRGIVAVRDLIPFANAMAGSPMESEARLVMRDGGLPDPELQHPIEDRFGITWHVDFAWPLQRLAVEFDGFDFHSSPEDLAQDRKKRAALIERGWTVLSIVGADVRQRPWELVSRIGDLLDRAAA